MFQSEVNGVRSGLNSGVELGPITSRTHNFRFYVHHVTILEFKTDRDYDGGVSRTLSHKLGSLFKLLADLSNNLIIKLITIIAGCEGLREYEIVC